MSFLDKAVRVIRIAASVVVDVFYSIPKRIIEKLVLKTVELETESGIASLRWTLDYLKILAVAVILAVFAVPFVDIYLSLVLIGVTVEFIAEAFNALSGMYVAKRAYKAAQRTEAEGDQSASNDETVPA
jgi:hypothetical protein